MITDDSSPGETEEKGEAHAMLRENLAEKERAVALSVITHGHAEAANVKLKAALALRDKELHDARSAVKAVVDAVLDAADQAEADDKKGLRPRVAPLEAAMKAITKACYAFFAAYPVQAEQVKISGDSSPSEVDDKQWVIVAAHISTEGVAYFWCPKFSGYTRDLTKAGRYTEAEAKAREVWTERMEVAVLFSEVEVVQFPAVSDDDAHRWFRRRFPGPKPTASDGTEASGCPRCGEPIRQEAIETGCRVITVAGVRKVRCATYDCVVQFR